MRRGATAMAALVLCALAGWPSTQAHAAGPDPLARLAERYAPVIVVRDRTEPCGDGEPYLPTAVETVLGKGDVVLRGPSDQALTAPSSSDLAGKGPGWYVDLPGDPLDPGCTYERWFTSQLPEPAATVYARTASEPDHPGRLALQFWFFWTYNDWNDKHEGDWEMIQLLFDADTVEEALAQAPLSTAFAQHEGSEVADWSDPKLLRDGDHVLVYPAEGSHAAYYTQAQWFGRTAAAGFGCDSTLAMGAVVRPAVALLPEAPSPGFEWLDYSGRWGEKAPSFNNGPTGPSTKRQWSEPVSWQAEEGRVSAVALPVIGGPAVESFCALTAGGSLLFITALDHPATTGLVLLSALVLVLLLVRGTRWRGADARRPDRERRAGQVVTASFGILGRHVASLWPIIAMVALTSVAALGLQRLAMHRRPSDDITDVYGVGQNTVALVLAALVSFAAAPLIAIALSATCRMVAGLAGERRPRAWEAIALAVRRPSGALAQLALYVVVTVLASSLVLLPLALLLVSMWAVTMPAAVIEDLGFVAAFRRSRALTRGRRWRAVFLSSLLVWIGFILPGLVGGVLLLVTGWPSWTSNAAAIVASAVLLPVSAIGLTLQFYDFRHEMLDRDALGRSDTQGAKA